MLMGFGILFTGLMGMTEAVAPLSGSKVFTDVLQKFSDVPILGILTGLITTFIVQSSSAMIGIVQALSSTGAFTFQTVYPLIMGIDLGTCITTAIICSIGTSKDAKRTGMAHIIFNCIGTVLFMIAITLLHNAGALDGHMEQDHEQRQHSQLRNAFQGSYRPRAAALHQSAREAHHRHS